MQDKMEESRKRQQYSPKEIERINQREMELLSLREHIEEQEKQLDEYRAKLKNDQLNREREFQNELIKREQFFSEREKSFAERQRKFEETVQIKQMENEELKNQLKMEVIKKEKELHKIRNNLEKEKERYNEESRNKIERTSKDYVSEALELLGKKESEFHTRSKSWAAIGAGAIVCGLVFFGYVTITSFSLIPNPVTWEFITFAVFKGLIVVILFAALAKYSLIFSNSYMREALKNADRRHAINFGKFYLESYGASAEWEQIKEAFEHWNIAGVNTFTKPAEVNLDVTALEKLTSAIENIGKAIPVSKNDKNA
ncbi:hypothetical protein [Candidatus Thiodiazotropha sp. CDECU1]|uniref:hypothetical protein n=1 Tax=Candidatus Thiodiazotropha sp. CDECU1 TaxID=3065865 RepID=UPI00292E2F65|nr:hypothetical protein [Candidatus Thiodiazotropha sp. CDECU1]